MQIGELLGPAADVKTGPGRNASVAHEAFTGFSTIVEITEAVARDVKPKLEAVTDEIAAVAS